MRLSTFLAIPVAALLAISPAQAAPKDELHAAFAKLIAARSFHAEVTDVRKNTRLTSMDFVAPDRYRIKTAAGPTQLVIEDTVYMDMDGQLMKIPVPGVAKMIAQYRDPQFVQDIERGMQVTALPDENVDGEPAKVYAYSVTRPVKADAKAWISPSSALPIQVETSGSFMGKATTTRVRYSRFDDPAIHIDMPD
ncbi:hypothetical protein [Dokdonella sp.]|uniref:LolA family protein n=1 Tax=Dokdonella sp. TaxID=2291710 RepID=UPI0025BFC50B|nr:hypothetical protein [Dokdonella sp.]MBX3689154.1 hypothetical protein [Dokdonella sp.]